MVVVVFGEATYNVKNLLLDVGLGEDDLSRLKDGDDGGMVFQQGESTHLARHRDGTGFALKQGIGRGDDFDVHLNYEL